MAKKAFNKKALFTSKLNLNKELPWQKKHSTRRMLFSPAN